MKHILLYITLLISVPTHTSAYGSRDLAKYYDEKPLYIVNKQRKDNRFTLNFGNVFTIGDLSESIPMGFNYGISYTNMLSFISKKPYFPALNANVFNNLFISNTTNLNAISFW